MRSFGSAKVKTSPFEGCIDRSRALQGRVSEELVVQVLWQVSEEIKTAEYLEIGSAP